MPPETTLVMGTFAPMEMGVGLAKDVLGTGGPLRAELTEGGVAM